MDRLRGYIGLEAAWKVASGHSRGCWKLRTCLHGYLNGAGAAAVGCACRPWFPSAAHGARRLRRSEGARHYPRTTLKKAVCGRSGRVRSGWCDRRTRQVRDLSCGDSRIYPEFEVRRVQCRSCGKVKRERLDFLVDNPFYTKRFAHYVDRLCRSTTIKDLAKELSLDWDTVKTLEKQYMQSQLAKAGSPGPKAIGIDEISIRKGHTYHIAVCDLIRARPIRFGGEDRSEKSMTTFYGQLGQKKSRGLRLAVMDMWKPFRNATNEHASQGAILFDTFHVMRHPGKALDEVRKSEHRRLSGRDRGYIRGKKYTLLSRRENLTLDGRKALKKLLAANSRLNRAYLLKESFGQL